MVNTSSHVSVFQIVKTMSKEIKITHTTIDERAGRREKMKLDTKKRWSIGLVAVLMVAMLMALNVSGVIALSPPATITISPEEDFNPIKTQHTFMAVVLRADGTPAADEVVEWILDRGPAAVGVIVDTVPRGKIDNTYAVTTTNAQGVSNVTITSTYFGDTNVIAYAPGITDTANHKAFAVKHWIDVAVEFPDDSVNPMGTEHIFDVKVTTINGAPLNGYPVRWTVLDNDPPVILGDDSTTGSTGVSSMTVNQVSPIQGENSFRIEVLSKGTPSSVMFSSTVKKTWVGPILSITKTGPATAQQNTLVTYDINVTNNGDAKATDLVIKDSLPSGLTYVSSSNGGSISGNAITWSLASMNVGGSASFSVVVKATEIGTWTDRVTVTCTEGLTDSAIAITKVASPILTITKTGTATAFVDDLVSYDVTIRNTGNADATDVMLSDVMPLAGLRLVSATTPKSSGPDATFETVEYGWNLGTITPGGIKRITVKARALTIGEWTNTATVTCAEGIDATANAKTMILAEPVGASIRVVDLDDPVTVGTEEIYTIIATNQGNSSMNNVILTFRLPTGGQFISATEDYEISGNVVTWDTKSTILVGDIFTVSVKVKMTLKGQLVSEAGLSYDEFPQVVTTQEGTTVY